MKKLISATLTIACLYSNAQTLIKVLDKSNNDEVSNALIVDNNNKQVFTNNLGIADVSGLTPNDILTIKHPSYNTYTFQVTPSENNPKIVFISSKLIVLDEVVFSANKSQEKQDEVPYSINIIKQKDIEFGNQPTSAEVLQNTGAVFVQKSQLGGGSPVLRGFEANKVLIVVDGVRMNNLIYRGGHLQDVITLDANMLDRTEVIFGPSSTIYGSDALGGVMHFYTKNAIHSTTDKILVKVNSMIRYGSASNEKTGHVDFSLGTKKFASLTNITFSDFGDLRSGTLKLSGSPNSWDRNYYATRYDATRANGEVIRRDTMTINNNNNLQIGSGYNQLDIMQRFNFKQTEFINHNINLQLSTSSNINRYDRLTETSTNTLIINGVKTNRLRFAEWYYGPQNRLFGAYTLSYNKINILTDDVKLILAYQKIDQDRISRNFQRTARTSQREDVTVLSANIDAAKRINTKHKLNYGIEFTSNACVSTADTTNIIIGQKGKAKTRYGDNGNSMTTFGAYVSHAFNVSDHFVITDGLRFTANALESKFQDTTFYKFPYTVAKQNSNAITGNLGFTWFEEENYKVSLLANTGFRTPNIDDMSKVFESAAVLIVPNPDIKPEYATNFELGISKIFNKNVKLDFITFYTVLENALVLADFKFNGADSALFNGTKRKTQAMQNKDRAYIYGFSGGVQFDFNEHLSFKGIVNYTYGRYADVTKDTIVPLDHIPPVFGQASLILKDKNLDGEFFVRFNGKKASADYSPSGEDNKQFSADIVNGLTPAWFTINARLGYNFTKNFRINLACENITDTRYRVFASGINAPGRNFIVSLRYKI